MIYIYIEQIIGFLVYFSFGFTILLFIQFKQKQNSATQWLATMSRFAILAVGISTSVYIHSLFNRFDKKAPVLLNLPYTENTVPGIIDLTPVKPFRKMTEEKIV